MGYVKVQRLCKINYNIRVYFGVYDLFCPDYLLETGTELHTILTDSTTSVFDKIQRAKKYLDFINPAPKYKTKFWIEVIIPTNTENIESKIKKKRPKSSPIYGTLVCNRVPLVRILFKNEYTMITNGVHPNYSSYSNNLDRYFRKVIIPRYIRSLESGKVGYSIGYGEISYQTARSYISLYMSKKFGWI